MFNAKSVIVGLVLTAFTAHTFFAFITGDCDLGTVETFCKVAALLTFALVKVEWEPTTLASTPGRATTCWNGKKQITCL